MSQLDFPDFDRYLIAQNGRIIHQVWFGTIPNKRSAKKSYEKMKRYRESWIVKNPTWLRIEWNKDMCKNLVKSFYPEHIELFEKYTYEIQRCDAIRYLILHRYGGWYADMDYYCNKPLDEAMLKFKNNILLVQTPNMRLINSDYVSNSLMFSTPHHPFWKQLMIDMEKNNTYPYYYGKHVIVMFTTGPGILNRVYSKYKYKYKVKSLPWKLFHPYGTGDEKLTLNNSDIYTVHISKGSWQNSDSKFYSFFVREWKIIVFILVLFIFLYFYRKYI
jgi:mannosyltransferase OCH1-like enzyme